MFVNIISLLGLIRIINKEFEEESEVELEKEFEADYEKDYGEESDIIYPIETKLREDGRLYHTLKSKPIIAYVVICLVIFSILIILNNIF